MTKVGARDIWNDRSKIYDCARDILGEHWNKPKPVNLKRLARRLDITLEFLPLNASLSGMSFIEGDKAYIGVNSLHHTNRQRFTVAHEIGHHVLHKDLLRDGTHVDTIILRRDHLSSEGRDKREIQANAFASELLIPKSLLESKLRPETDMQDEELLRSLAEEFQVSLSALHYRLARA